MIKIKFHYFFIILIFIVYIAMNNYPPLRSGEKWVEYEDNGLLYELQNGKKIGEKRRELRLITIKKINLKRKKLRISGNLHF